MFLKEILLNIINSKSPNYKRFFALIDDEDFERVNQYIWHIKRINNWVYACAFIDGEFIYLHNFITGLKWIDHKNGIGLDCQKDNLRGATNQQNQFNQRLRQGGTSKYKGVCLHKSSKKWQAYIKFNYKSIHLGLFNSEREAGLAYNRKAKELFGEFARLNPT